MTSKLDELEQMVMAEMRKVYSEKAIDHAMNPRNVGHIKGADGYARVTGPCGDTVEISPYGEGGKSGGCQVLEPPCCHHSPSKHF